MMTLTHPSHPGIFVRTEILEALQLSVTKAADVLGVSRQALSTFINGRASLSADMAIRLEKAFGVRMGTLLRMQNSYDIAMAQGLAKHIHVKAYRTGKKTDHTSTLRT